MRYIKSKKNGWTQSYTAWIAFEGTTYNYNASDFLEVVYERIVAEARSVE